MTRSEPATRLLLIRHGETDWNAEGRYQGHLDPGLNARGRAQAEDLGRRLAAGKRPAVIYSSPLARAFETAEALAAATGAPLHAEPRFKEIHQGEWQGMLKREIGRHYPRQYRLWNEEPWAVRLPGGETLDEVAARVYPAIDEILARHPGARIAIVSHQMPLALLKVRFQGIDPAGVRRFRLVNTHCEEVAVYADPPSRATPSSTSRRATAPPAPPPTAAG